MPKVLFEYVRGSTLFCLKDMFGRAQAKLASMRVLQGRLRLVFPVVFIAILKLLAATYLYEYLSQPSGAFQTLHMKAWHGPRLSPAWLYLFSAWDTGHYVSIAMNWYEYPRYVFFPAYPALCRIIGVVTGDPWLSAFIVSFTLGLASIPLFQLVSECYMCKGDAVILTLLAMTFPYVFLFTTVSYAESLFLFSTLSSWYFYLRKKFVASALAATAATLSKTYGIAILVPIAVSILINRKTRKVWVFAVPVAALLGWMYYLYIMTRNPFAFLSQQEHWIGLGGRFGWVQNYLIPFLSFAHRPDPRLPEFFYIEIAFIVTFGYLAFSVLKVDTSLGIYSISMYMGLLYFGNLLSLPRYFAFIFPIWLVVGGRVRNPLLVVAPLVFFVLNSLIIWAQFLNLVWVS